MRDLSVYYGMKIYIIKLHRNPTSIGLDSLSSCKIRCNTAVKRTETDKNTAVVPVFIKSEAMAGSTSNFFSYEWNLQLLAELGIPLVRPQAVKRRETTGFVRPTSNTSLFFHWSRARVFSEVPFWNSAEYRILYGIGFISRNSAKFFAIHLWNSAEFRIGSCIRNSVYLQISPLHLALCRRESSLKILEDSLGP
jgi:hypothetical protein